MTCVICSRNTGKQAAEDNESIKYSKKNSLHQHSQRRKIALSAYHRHLPKDLYTIVAIEEPFSITFDGLDVPIIGVMDLVEEDSAGTIIITENKTSARAYSNSQIDKNLQLTVYQIAARSNGYKKREILLRIDCLIKTQVPTFKTYYTHRDSLDEYRAIRKIIKVWDGIKKRVFVPNDTSWKCPIANLRTHTVISGLPKDMEEIMVELNKKQKAAAEFKTGIASVVAVPGSGKTLTMTHRIGNLVNNGVPPENILGLTFTRNAAQAMREKLVPVLDDQASRVNLSTIHSFCHSLLRNEGRTFEILHGKEQIKFIRQIMKKKRIRNIPTGLVLREIGLAKNNLISVEEFCHLYEGDDTMLKIADVYEAYEAEKRKKLLLDFNDLLIETYELLKGDEDIKRKYQEAYKHILVDEFQDTNPSQMEILNLLVKNQNGNGTSFYVTGDDWQSIYAFTGASIGNILNFGKAFPNSRQFISGYELPVYPSNIGRLPEPDQDTTSAVLIKH
jgi:hypothetical protein